MLVSRNCSAWTLFLDLPNFALPLVLISLRLWALILCLGPLKPDAFTLLDPALIMAHTGVEHLWLRVRGAMRLPEHRPLCAQQSIKTSIPQKERNQEGPFRSSFNAVAEAYPVGLKTLNRTGIPLAQRKNEYPYVLRYPNLAWNGKAALHRLLPLSS